MTDGLQLLKDSVSFSFSWALLYLVDKWNTWCLDQCPKLQVQDGRWASRAPPCELLFFCWQGGLIGPIHAYLAGLRNRQNKKKWLLMSPPCSTTGPRRLYFLDRISKLKSNYTIIFLMIIFKIRSNFDFLCGIYFWTRKNSFEAGTIFLQYKKIYLGKFGYVPLKDLKVRYIIVISLTCEVRRSQWHVGHDGIYLILGSFNGINPIFLLSYTMIWLLVICVTSNISLTTPIRWGEAVAAVASWQVWKWRGLAGQARPRGRRGGSCTVKRSNREARAGGGGSGGSSREERAGEAEEAVRLI